MFMTQLPMQLNGQVPCMIPTVCEVCLTLHKFQVGAEHVHDSGVNNLAVLK